LYDRVGSNWNQYQNTSAGGTSPFSGFGALVEVVEPTERIVELEVDQSI
jgi:hypothetical protein